MGFFAPLYFPALLAKLMEALMVRGECWQTSGGKPTFPTMSLSELSFNSSVKGLQGGINRTNHSISKVGKAGLPPLPG